MTVRTRTVSTSRSSSRPLSPASSPGASATESRTVPGWSFAAMSLSGEEPIAPMSLSGEEPIAPMSLSGEEPIAPMSLSGEEPIAVPISGAGNQVSSTVPPAATVASPTPAAEVTGLHRTGRLALSPVGLDLRSDPIALTAALVDIPSESRREARIADEVEAALHGQADGFEVLRHGNAVLARTHLDKPSRVLL